MVSYDSIKPHVWSLVLLWCGLQIPLRWIYVLDARRGLGSGFREVCESRPTSAGFKLRMKSCKNYVGSAHLCSYTRIAGEFPWYFCRLGFGRLGVLTESTTIHGTGMTPVQASDGKYCLNFVQRIVYGILYTVCGRWYMVRHIGSTVGTLYKQERKHKLLSCTKPIEPKHIVPSTPSRTKKNPV